MKVLALFCLRSGAALNVATARPSAHDNPLARKLWHHLHKRDVLLGDRAFGDFVTMALPPLRGVDVVARLHQGRAPDFGKPHKLLAPDDAVLPWKKPLQRPSWISEARWSRVPEQVHVRVIRSRMERPGFRTQEVLVATTLLDPERHPAAEMAEACLRRWRIELSFRDNKTSMELEDPRAEGPDIATRELLAGLVAYNLVRVTMIEAACRHGAPLDRRGFKGTADGLRHDGPRMARARSRTALRRVRGGLFRAVAKDLVPNRPGRREPRAIKRRPKPFAHLTQPRHQHREIPHRNRRSPGKTEAPASPTTPPGSAIRI